MEENKKEEEVKLRNAKPQEKFNNKPSQEIKNKLSNDFNKKYARKLSKMHITSTNWNINQLGDINTYPDAMEIEE